MSLSTAVEAFRRSMILDALARHGGNRSQTAKALGINRTYLQKLIRDLGIPSRRASR